MMTVVEFPINKMDALAELADSELNDWCVEKVEQGLDPVYLVGILQYNVHYMLANMVEEE
tara:strand:+ start:1771 stop:1950 length:180 start_codon:yes stop_codon:yes gene_type:complete